VGQPPTGDCSALAHRDWAESAAEEKDLQEGTPSLSATTACRVRFLRTRPPSIYGGLILGAIGWGCLRRSPLALLGALGLTAFFDLKSRREEIWLPTSSRDTGPTASRTRRCCPGSTNGSF